MTEKNQHTILKTQNLSIGYQSKKNTTVVASSIDIELHEGELVGLVGANGIGKSTLLRTLSQIQKPIDGDVLINNKPISQYNPIDLAKVLSLVLTESVASKNLTVFELIALGRQPYTNWIGKLSKNDIDIIHKAISHTHIKNILDKKCFQLSDGQLQKTMITRALAQDTSLIVLDEPTTHLDMYHKAYVLKLLQKLAKDTNKTILFSSHEIDLAIQLCDKLIVMSNDGIISDTPKNLIKDGAFNGLFPKDLIVFDEETGSFRVKK